MGIIVQYVTTKDRNILLKIAEQENSGLTLENYLNENKSEIISFGTFVKSWNPLYFLLKKISGHEIFDMLANLQSNETYDQYTKLINQEDVKVIFHILNTFSSAEIQGFLDDGEFCKIVSEQPGYNMDYIYDPESILIEFTTLKDAVQSAYSIDAALVQVFYP
ncbi:DUF1877 family protein [Chryseobacterium nepalense]|uniref:DUF1877 family protein n=1 Tax=Chryseobacterium nepalense TaxID=1854498 RepID=UPI002E0345DD|nr:hypothetical protein [Chryseobacterium nepalense]